ncbi:MAG TPA: hypothetical protein VHW69_14465 [Rhizomicrobium sp.]|jgi:hypothetical protein|nr:hypothetical protein [Rhizomicrobium sp.]
MRLIALAAFAGLLANAVQADPISGRVERDGSVAVPSPLYSVIHPSAGHYTIKFATPMEPSASCLFFPFGTNRRGYVATVVKETESSTDCSIALKSLGRGSFHNYPFSFIAVPMSN